MYASSIVAVVVLAAVGVQQRWWSEYFGNPGKAGWKWVEANSWVLGILFGGITLALTIWQVRRERRQHESPSEPARDATLLDRDDDYRKLRNRLRNGPGGVVSVIGPPGIGKSKLVSAVLTEIRSTVPTARVCERAAEPGVRLDVRLLIADLEEREDGRPAQLQPGQYPLGRLEATLEDIGSAHIIIVIESAQHLAAREDQAEVDLPLDEALEVFATHHRHRVIVVLVSQAKLRSKFDGVWQSGTTVDLDRLPEPEFDQLLQAGEAKRRPGRKKLSVAERALAYRQLHGNPRCAKYLMAHVRHPEAAMPAARLLEQLAHVHARDAPKRLAEILVRGLGERHRAVLQALAAFGIPVDVRAINAVSSVPVADYEAAGILSVLEDVELVRYVDHDRYFLSLGNVDWLLPTDGAERLALLRRATDVIATQRVERPETIGDLQAHFTQLKLMLKTERYAEAYDVIEDTAEVLNEWNCGFLLREQREKVRDKLGHPFLEMVNDNELGDIYGELGCFDEGSDAYGRALQRAKQDGTPLILTALHANLGSLYWQDSQAQSAYNYYRQALHEAQEHGSAAITMGALEGLADCNRRWGRYTAALDYAKQALDAVAEPNPSDSVSLLLRLARWNAEIRRYAQADEALREATRLAAPGGGWRLAACRDAEADLLLARGLTGEAISTAADALAQAIRVHDPVTIVQARTTIGMAYLMQGEPDKAREHIENAERYRRGDRALIVLALLAVITQYTDSDSAHVHFDELAKLARQRIGKDGQDFGAHDMLAFAICGQQLHTSGPLTEAVHELQTSDELTKDAAPVLRDRRHVLVSRLDKFAPHRLRPVLDYLSGAPSDTTG